MYRPVPPKDSTARVFKKQNIIAPRIHSRHFSTKLLQKKPQILLMKWNNVIEQYHLWKQLLNINTSLFMTQTAQKKIDKLQIQDVEYIVSQQVSEQVSVQEKFQDEIYIENSDDSEVSVSIEGNKEVKVQQSKICDRQKLIQSKYTEDDHQDNDNYTDEEDQFIQQSLTKLRAQSTNKNSKLNESFCSEYSINSSLHKQKLDVHNLQPIKQSYLQKTPFFSFSEQFDIQQTLSKGLSIKGSKNNQQNYNHLNKQIKSKKVQIMLKMSSQQQKRRERARKIMMEDRQYLNQMVANRKNI